MAARIAVLPGDGIGPEITAPTLELLDRLGDFTFEEHLFGGASIDAHGIALTDETLAACRAADAVLLAAVGGPKWDTTDPPAPRPEQGLLGLRKELGLYANLRPVRAHRCAARRQPAAPRGRRGHATCSWSASSPAASTSAPRRAPTTTPRTSASTPSRRSSASPASRSAPPARKVTSVDKANVLETSRLWREVVRRVHAEEFPHVELEHALVDSTAMKLVTAPRHFDVILTENMFGDILSDEAASSPARSACCPARRSATAGPASSSPSTARRPTSPARGSPTRWPCSCRPP